MQITGKNLKTVHEALDLAVAEVHNQIATCPDVTHYEAELIDLEDQKAKLLRFQQRVAKAIEKENRNA